MEVPINRCYVPHSTFFARPFYTTSFGYFLNFFDLGITKDMEAVKGNSFDVQGAKAAVKGKATVVEEEFIGISSLRVGLKVAIKVMLCRKWDVTNIYGKYRSTDFVVSDEQGTAIQCSARSNISHCFVSKLEEGKIYSLSNFTVVANNTCYDGYRNCSIVVTWWADCTQQICDTTRTLGQQYMWTLQDIQDLKEESNRKKIFGGITVLLGGDFRQILPVISKGRRQDIVRASINNSPLWNQCQMLTLTQGMRVKALREDGRVDPTRERFNEWVLKIGDGKAPTIAIDEHEEETWIEIPSEFTIQPQEAPIQQIIDAIYPDFILNQENVEYLQERAILTPLNEDADGINEHMFNKVQGRIKYQG